MSKLKGKIIVNPYKCPGQSVKQAEALKEQFIALGVEVEIVYDGYLHSGVIDSNLQLDLGKIDFVVFLDKDKYLVEIIERSGVRVFNPSKQIAVCDDKGQTCIALAGNGVKMPKTVFAPVCYVQSNPVREDLADRVESQLGYPVIIKSAYGSMGNGVFKADNRPQLLSVMEKLKTQPHIFQEYLGKKFGTDVRVIVLGGKAIACMLRKNQTDFRSNVGQGGKGTKIELSDQYYKEYIACAEKCAQILALDYCGVDLLVGEDDKPVVCEVNSNAFFEEISLVSGVNVAKAYAEYVIKQTSK